MGESHMTTEVAMLPLFLQVKNRWAWPAAAGGWERGQEQILGQSPKKRTTCHHCDATLPEDCERVGMGCPKSPGSVGCHTAL